MSNRNVRFWRELFPLLKRFCVDSKTPLNKVVNIAVLRFLRGDDVTVEVLKLEAKKFELLKEEAELRKTWSAIARSGAYLSKYAARVLKPQEAKQLARVEYAQARDFNYDRHYNLGAAEDLPREGSEPLKALSRKEEALFKRVCARREAIAKELVEIEEKLLPLEKFRFKPSRSRARDKKSAVEEVKT